MVIKILTIEDYDELRDQIIEFFEGSEIESNQIKIEGAESFDLGIEKIKENDYDIVILDLCKGKPSEENKDRPGFDVLQSIRKNTFCPVIFYTGIGHSIRDVESTIVGVVSKSEGLEKLYEKIEGIIKSNIGLLKQKIHKHINDSLRDFFWESVHENKGVFSKIEGDISLGYLMLRRIANSLSKENIKVLLNDSKVDSEKAHPMEYYIYPVEPVEYNAAEILNIEGQYYVILTPSCDFIEADTRKRKAEKVLLAAAKSLENIDQFKKYLNGQGKTNTNDLLRVIESRQSDRFFFLPETPFLSHSLVIDFQDKDIVSYEELSKFKRVARLDSPFAESMLSSFIRYYNRVGSPDIDSAFMLENINKKYLKA